jgi:cytochrome P450
MIYGSELPGLFLDTKMSNPILVVSDPDLVEEIYGSKNTFFDRSYVGERFFKHILHSSILAATSNGTWAIKRKILTQSFYKDKLMKLITIIIRLAD